MKEKWKPIPGYEGLYAASDQGRVKSLRRMVRHNYGGLKTIPEKILKQTIDKYAVVTLSKENQVRNYGVHRLVLMAFVGLCPEGMEARHFPDRNPINNNLTNLSWGSPLENQTDRKFQGTAHKSTSLRGAACSWKLTDRDVEEIREKWRTKKYLQRELAVAYGVNAAYISTIVNHKYR